MQSEYEKNKLQKPFQGSGSPKFNHIPASNGHSQSVIELVEDRQIANQYVELNNLRDLTQGSGVWEKVAKSRIFRPSAERWRQILFLSDSALIVIILTLTLSLADSLHFNLQLSTSPSIFWNSMVVLVLLGLVSWGAVTNITRTYDLTNAANRFRSLITIFLTVVMTDILWTLLSEPITELSITAFFKVLLLFTVLALPILSIWRLCFTALMNASRFRQQAVIVGLNASAEIVAREISNSKQPLANILGYICEDADGITQKDGLLVIGGRAMLRRIIRSGMVDMIIMAIDYRTYPELFQETLEAAQHGISILPMPLAYERMSGKIPVEHVGDQWYLSLPLDRVPSLFYLSWRRVMDISFGLVGTFFMLLILPVIAALIYLDSPGPIFYSQERLGYQGKPFRILKFRSMRTDAERLGRAMWAAESDPRVTRVGRFMRATHFDELPQVLNILRGDMSLIGPRPERQQFVSELEKTIPFYRCRMTVKPGLTGWAQVKYPYTSTGEDALVKLQFDLYYIKYQSVMLDIFILLNTVLEILHFNGR